MPTILINEQQTADYLGVSRKTLQAWRFRGRGPIFRKIGRLCRYAVIDLEAYIEAARRRSTSDPGSIRDQLPVEGKKLK